MSKDTIYRQAAIDLVKDVCDAILSGCDSYYDSETGDEVYKDILEVDAILKCNKEIRIALRNMPSAQPERDIPVEPNEIIDRTWGIPQRQPICPRCDYYLGRIYFIGDGGSHVVYCEKCGQAINLNGWDFEKEEK